MCFVQHRRNDIIMHPYVPNATCCSHKMRLYQRAPTICSQNGLPFYPHRSSALTLHGIWVIKINNIQPCYSLFKIRAPMIQPARYARGGVKLWVSHWLLSLYNALKHGPDKEIRGTGPCCRQCGQLREVCNAIYSLTTCLYQPVLSCWGSKSPYFLSRLCFNVSSLWSVYVYVK